MFYNLKKRVSVNILPIAISFAAVGNNRSTSTTPKAVPPQCNRKIIQAKICVQMQCGTHDLTLSTCHLKALNLTMLLFNNRAA